MGVSYYREPIGYIVMFIITLLMYVQFNVKISSTLKKVVLIWSLYAFGLMIAYRTILEFFYLRNLIYILITYLFVNIYGKSFFVLFEKYVYYLALISLIFFTWQYLDLISLSDFMNTFDVNSSTIQTVKSFDSNKSKNIIIYTLNYNAFTNDAIRNCGFAWEPGPFSIFIVFAIYFNLLRTNMQIQKNRTLYILFFALVTTFSTTGYVAFGVIMLNFTTFNLKGPKKYLLTLLLGFIILSSFFYFDFLYNKILTLYSSGNAEVLVKRVGETQDRVSLGRFSSLAIAWEDFKNHPLFGLGGASQASVYGGYLVGRINIISGISSIIRTYGLFGIILISFYLYKSSLLVATLFNSKTKYTLFYIILISLFGFQIHVMTILFSIIFFSLFMPESKGVK